MLHLFLKFGKVIKITAKVFVCTKLVRRIFIILIRNEKSKRRISFKFSEVPKLLLSKNPEIRWKNKESISREFEDEKWVPY